MEPVQIHIDDYVGYGNASHWRVKAKMEQARGKKVKVVLSGYGGQVIEGVGIYNLLRGHDADVEVHIATWAFSADSVIAMGGKRTTMPDNGFFMVHNVRGGAYGESSDLQHRAAIMDMMSAQLIEIYDRKTSLGKDRLKAMMDKEAWLTAREALELGFVDALTPGTQLANDFDPEIFNSITPPPLPTAKQQPATNKPANMKLNFLNTVAAFFGLTAATATTDDIEKAIKKHGTIEQFRAALGEELKKGLKAEHDRQLGALQKKLKNAESDLAASTEEAADLKQKVTGLTAEIADRDREIESLKNEGGGDHPGGKKEPDNPGKKSTNSWDKNPVNQKAKALKEIPDMGW